MTQPRISFDYIRAMSFPEAFDLLHLPGAIPMMGGCDVMTRFRRGRLGASLVVGLRNIPGISDLHVDGDSARIGAAVTLDQLRQSRLFAQSWPFLASVCASIASPAIRGAGTLVGNIAQCWRSSDLVPLLLLCDAQLMIMGPQGERRLNLAQFTEEKRKAALHEREIISRIELQASGPGNHISYERIAKLKSQTLPLVAVAARSFSKGMSSAKVRVAVVGGSEQPRRCMPAEQILLSGLTRDNIGRAADELCRWASPASDHHGSADYRRHLLKVAANKAFLNLARETGEI